MPAMTTILANAQIVDPVEDRVSRGHLVLQDGVIAAQLAPGDPLPEGDIQDCGDAFLAPGIVDIGVKICEPGERHKESFASGGRAAASGGVTTIVTRPDTDPVIDTPERLEFVHRRAVADSPVRVVPMACLTKEGLGAR